jgi:hypothetical protein
MYLNAASAVTILALTDALTRGPECPSSVYKFLRSAVRPELQMERRGHPDESLRVRKKGA